MTQVHSSSTVAAEAGARVRPPWSRAARYVAGAALVLGGLLNGLPQWLSQALLGDLTFEEELRWAASNPLAMQAEQVALLVSVLFIPLGLLGVAQVTRWRAPRLTALGIALAFWGMWGFQNILALGYVPRVVVPPVLGPEAAAALDAAFSRDAAVVATALVPHLVGSFLGVLLLAVAGWRTRTFPRTACALLVVFLVWDFLLPSVGPIEPHLLLAVAWTWMGLHILRMDDQVWQGGATV